MSDHACALGCVGPLLAKGPCEGGCAWPKLPGLRAAIEDSAAIMETQEGPPANRRLTQHLEMQIIPEAGTNDEQHQRINNTSTKTHEHA